MSNKIPCTPQELAGKWICCFRVFPDTPYLDCVRYNSGGRADLPVLYNSAEEAMADEYFDENYDKVVPALEFFELIKNQ